MRTSCDFPATTDQDAICRSTAIQNCYEHPRLVDFPATSADDLRHLRRAGRARCFHDTRLAGVGASPGKEAFPPTLRGVLPTSGCPRRTTHSRSRLPRGEPRRRSALAEDPRKSRRDRFHRRSVKTAGFPDLEHLRPMSTRLGCSSMRMASPPPLGLSSFFSPDATNRTRLVPWPHRERSPFYGASRGRTTPTDFCNTITSDARA